MNRKPQFDVLGIGWHTPATFAQFRADPELGHQMDMTYPEWLFRTEAAIREATAQGIKVEKILWDIPAFKAFCRAADIKPNAEARAAFIISETRKRRDTKNPDRPR